MYVNSRSENLVAHSRFQVRALIRLPRKKSVNYYIPIPSVLARRLEHRQVSAKIDMNKTRTAFIISLDMTAKKFARKFNVTQINSSFYMSISSRVFGRTLPKTAKSCGMLIESQETVKIIIPFAKDISEYEFQKIVHMGVETFDFSKPRVLLF